MRRSRPLLGEELERRTLLAGIAFQFTSLASEVTITPAAGGPLPQDDSIPDVNSGDGVNNNLKYNQSNDVYSENILTTSPSTDQSSNVLDIVSRGGLTSHSLFSVSQSAGLATDGTPGDVTVNIVPTDPSEKPGDKVTVQPLRAVPGRDIGRRELSGHRHRRRSLLLQRRLDRQPIEGSRSGSSHWRARPGVG